MVSPLQQNPPGKYGHFLGLVKSVLIIEVSLSQRF